MLCQHLRPMLSAGAYRPTRLPHINTSHRPFPFARPYPLPYPPTHHTTPRLGLLPSHAHTHSHTLPHTTHPASAFLPRTPTPLAATPRRRRSLPPIARPPPTRPSPRPPCGDAPSLPRRRYITVKANNMRTLNNRRASFGLLTPQDIATTGFLHRKTPEKLC